jgi:sarcosine oxidase subunit delta
LRDLWYHEPCASWIAVDRDTVSHAIHGAVAVADLGGRE